MPSENNPPPPPIISPQTINPPEFKPLKVPTNVYKPRTYIPDVTVYFNKSFSKTASSTPSKKLLILKAIGGGFGVIFASEAEMKVPIAGVSMLFTE